eukprot:PhM_4_TR800/c0_g1_i1/m.8557
MLEFSPVTDVSASTANKHNIYEYLMPKERPTELNPTLMLLSVVRYDGDFDALGRFHGSGRLVSAMGYTYDGNFIAGQMHGKGKITWADGTTYEGDFADNRVTGSGLYTMASGDEYRGGVSRGMREGRGSYKQVSTGCTYDGDWVSGVKQGRGVMYYTPDATTYYRGEWEDDLPNGRGIMVFPSGSVYEGDWCNGMPHGSGVLVHRENGEVVEEQRGTWVEGRPQGEGTTMYITPHVSATGSLTYSDASPTISLSVPGSLAISADKASMKTSMERDAAGKDTTINRYTGTFVDGKREGSGVFLYEDGSKYEGQWVANERHGEGRFTHPNGTLYMGKFENGRLVKTGDVKLLGVTATGMAATSQPQFNDQLQASGPNNTTSNTNSGASAVPSTVLLFIEDLLFASRNADDSARAIQALISRHNGSLRRMFQQYCAVDRNKDGALSYLPFLSSSVPEASPSSLSLDATGSNQMVLSQLWKFVSDCHMFTYEFTVAHLDRIVETVRHRFQSNTTDLVVPKADPPKPTKTSQEAPGPTSSKSIQPEPRRSTISATAAAVSATSRTQSVPLAASHSITSTIKRNQANAAAQRAASGALDIHHGHAIVISFRDFVEVLVRIAHVKFAHIMTSDLGRTVQYFLEDIIHIHGGPNAVSTGQPLFRTLREVNRDALVSYQPLFEAIFLRYRTEAYQGLEMHRAPSLSGAADRTLTVRQFLSMLKDAGCIDTHLTLHGALKAFEGDPTAHHPEFTEVSRKVERRLLQPTGNTNNALSNSSSGIGGFGVIPSPSPSVDAAAPGSALLSPQDPTSGFYITDKAWERKLQAEAQAAGPRQVNVVTTLAVDAELTLPQFVESLCRVARARASKTDAATSTAVQDVNIIFMKFVQTYLEPLAAAATRGLRHKE